MEPLMSGNLCLRPFVEDAADVFAAAVRESVATVGLWMPWCHAGYTADEARQWFAICERSLAEKSAYEFGIFAADGKRFLGGAGLNQLNRLNNCCNLGYWVRESCQRQGVATRTLRLLAEFGFASLGLTRIEIVVAQGNVPSGGVARKAGAVHEGVARNRLVLRGVPVDASVYSLFTPGTISTHFYHG